MAAILLTLPRGPQPRWKAVLQARPLLDVLVMLVAVEGLYLYQEFVTDGYALETYYYTSYEFVFIVLGATLVVAELAERPWFGEGGAWVLAALRCGFPWPGTWPSTASSYERGQPYRSWWR